MAKCTRVLVIEDEPLVRDVIAAALRRAGYAVVTTQDPVEAVSLVEHEAVDVVFSDLRIPEGESGWDLAWRLRAVAPNLPAVYAAKSPDPSGLEQPNCLRLIKPFKVPQVVEAIRTLAAARAPGAKTGVI